MFLKSNLNHRNIYIAGFILLVVGLPLSHVLISTSQIIIFSNWLIEGEFKRKWKNFFSNKTALVVSAVWIIHLIGLFYSEDLSWAFRDVKKKIPLFLLPLIFTTIPPLSVKEFKLLLKFFIGAIFAGTIVSTAVLTGITGIKITDVRQISIFISHIRFSLMICIAMFICIYFAIESKGKERILYISSIIWFFIFLILMESLTGLISLAIGIIVLLFRWAIKRKSYRLAIITTLSILILLPPLYIGYEVKTYFNVPPLNISELEKFTKNGEPYYHEYENREIENGNYVRTYIAIEELTESWNKRSKIPFNGLDRKGHFIEYTIFRFLTSKDLRKDAEGLDSLTDEEIEAIENGIANVDYQDRTSLRDRIRQAIWEVDWYSKNYNPTGHSVTMRLEFWKTAVNILKKNLISGVGTGDVPNAFILEYEQSNTQLGRDFWLRSHNQFLSIGVAFGIFGLAYFILSLLFPFFSLSQSRSYLYVLFFTISTLSMFTEDTLETQVGVTFFAFFNSFFLFGIKDQTES